MKLYILILCFKFCNLILKKLYLYIYDQNLFNFNKHLSYLSIIFSISLGYGKFSLKTYFFLYSYKVSYTFLSFNNNISYSLIAFRIELVGLKK